MASERASRNGEEASPEEKLLALFIAAGITVRTVWELPNGYWPDAPSYADVRRRSPWLLVKTEWGLVQIGWRKRVIQIDWSDTPVRGEVTTHDVTKSDVLVHAWSEERAVEYLKAWKALACSTRSESASIKTSDVLPDLSRVLPKTPYLTGMTFTTDVIVNGHVVKAGTEIKFATPAEDKA